MIRKHVILAAIAAVLIATTSAFAVAPEIKDEGKFFSPETIKKANEQIREIARKYDKDILVETFASVPADKAEQVKGMSHEERVKFFHTWATERAEHEAVNGVYILVCKEPAHVHVEIRSKSAGVINPELRKKVGDLLVENFRMKRFDDGLMNAIKMVREKLAAADKEPQGKELFDGKSLTGWKKTDFGGQGEVSVKDGTIVMERGSSMTGITWTGKPPKTNYELTLEGKRLQGSDFFCTTTFPVGDECCSLVMGGWGGGLVGLSSIDGDDASQNSTGDNHDFENNKWYRVRIRVTEAMIECWIDDKQVVKQERKDHKIGIRSECKLCKPLGICTYETTGAVKNIRLLELKQEEAAPAAGKEKK